MSLPSTPAIMQEMGIANIRQASATDRRKVLVSAIKRDLPLACDYLHKMAHELINTKTASIFRVEDPNSPLGKQLIRIAASTPMRRIAEETLLHGMRFSFVNCCNVRLSEVPEPEEEEELELLQIEAQNGVLAHADC